MKKGEGAHGSKRTYEHPEREGETGRSWYSWDNRILQFVAVKEQRIGKGGRRLSGELGRIQGTTGNIRNEQRRGGKSSEKRDPLKSVDKCAGRQSEICTSRQRERHGRRVTVAEQ